MVLDVIKCLICCFIHLIKGIILSSNITSHGYTAVGSRGFQRHIHLIENLLSSFFHQGYISILIKEKYCSKFIAAHAAGPVFLMD